MCAVGFYKLINIFTFNNIFKEMGLNLKVVAANVA